MSNSFDKQSLLDSFIEEVNSYLPEIEAHLDHLALLPHDMGALNETHRLTHTIGGSASMMDFPGLTHVARGMEDILADALDELTTLDEPTIGLLRRSLGRLHQLLEGIRNGVDEEAIIKEDDDDYNQYRAQFDAVAQGSDQSFLREEEESMTQARLPASPLPTPQFETPPPAPSPLPSFDEVLASFRAPSVSSGEDLAWPEEPVPSPQLGEAFATPQFEPSSFSAPATSSTSAWDELVASTRQPSLSPLPASSSDAEMVPPVQSESEFAFDQIVPWEPPAMPVPQAHELPEVYEDVQRGVQQLDVEVASLKDLLTQLRTAISVIEEQRSEFKRFLDGSKDALDRMEEWAGKAMGLNLRNSPEQVRKYLPLSVMWVANTKLKKVLDLLGKMSGNVEATDEQVGSTLQQLQASITSCGETFIQLQQQASSVSKETPWSAWEMQIDHEPDLLRERVIFERQGDSAAVRAEVEAQVRAELEREYEMRSSSATLQRAEIEQQIRDEVRQEYENRLEMLQEAQAAPPEDMIQVLEERIKKDIEIQVRQEFLEQLKYAMGDANNLANLARSNATPAPAPTNFLDRASEAMGISVPIARQNTIPASTVPMTPQPLPMVNSTPTATNGSTSSIVSDFGEEAAEIFRMEAQEHLQTISMNVAALEKSPENRELIQGIRRATHTLKGAASMMGFRMIADLSHVSEDLLDSIMEDKMQFREDVLGIILDTAETLDILITGKGDNGPEDEARVQVLRVRYAELLGEPQILSRSVDEDLDVTDEHHTDTTLITGVVADEATSTNGTGPQRANKGELSVRVRLQRLDELVNLFGELLVNRSVLEERVQRLVRLVSDVGVSSNRLRDVGQKLESRFEAATLPSGRSIQTMPGEGDQSIMLARRQNRDGENELAYLEDFDELELDRYTEFHQLARGLSEGISDMTTLSSEMDAVIRECESVFARENRLSTTFQDRLMKVRLVPLSTMAPQLYRAARAVALKQHKQIDFVLEGDDTEVDRTVFEEISGPLLHLVRNAVNHAIETPDVRLHKGKAAAGMIKLSASYEGNHVVITVGDDGAGLDAENIRSVAVARGLIRPDQPISENEVLELIFRPGFTTAESVTEESGRGVGLDVVRDSVSRLRGTLIVDSMPGQGTSFTMKFPTSLAIQSAVMVRVGSQQFAIPTVVIETIGRLDNFTKRSTTTTGQSAVVVRDEFYPLSSLAQYLSMPVTSIDEKAPLLLVNTNGQRVALVVDEVKEKFDIVMKNLGPHLRRVHGIAGGTVLGNGRVVLILELSDLLSNRPGLVTTTSTNMLGRRDIAPTGTQTPVRQSIDLSSKQGASSMRSTVVASPTAERGKHVLIVDDSPSVRRVVGNMLKQRGWEVQMARDGVEALEMISYETPAAVLLDIEMPRMDGYELIATVRAQEQYRSLPLVVLTSRAATKHKQRAMQLGASDYVVKPYQDEELIEILTRRVYGTVAVK